MTELEPIGARVSAPPDFAYWCLTTFDTRSPVWEPELEPEILDGGGNVLVVRFRERVLGRLVASIERVRLFPPDRMTFELLGGAISSLRRETVVRALPGGTARIEHRGDVALALPLAVPLERILAVPILEAGMRRMLGRQRVTIEAAARAAGLADPLRAAAESRDQDGSGPGELPGA